MLCKLIINLDNLKIIMYNLNILSIKNLCNYINTYANKYSILILNVFSNNITGNWK